MSAGGHCLRPTRRPITVPVTGQLDTRLAAAVTWCRARESLSREGVTDVIIKSIFIVDWWGKCRFASCDIGYRFAWLTGQTFEGQTTIWTSSAHTSNFIMVRRATFSIQIPVYTTILMVHHLSVHMQHIFKPETFINKKIRRLVQTLRLRMLSIFSYNIVTAPTAVKRRRKPSFIRGWSNTDVVTVTYCHHSHASTNTMS